jgi:hypothetical protein
MFPLRSYAKIIRSCAALAVVAAAFVLVTPTTVPAAAPPGPSIVVDSVLLFPQIPATGNCLSFVNFTVSGLNGGSSKAEFPFTGDPDNHQWFAFGQAIIGTSSFSFTFPGLTTHDNGVTDTVIPTNGSPVIPNNGATSQWTMTLQDSKGATVASSNTLVVTDSC